MAKSRSVPRSLAREPSHHPCPDGEMHGVRGTRFLVNQNGFNAPPRPDELFITAASPHSAPTPPIRSVGTSPSLRTPRSSLRRLYSEWKAGLVVVFF